MDRFKFISHALFLYLASGIFIYIPMGIILTYLPTGQIDQVKADVDEPEMFSLEWLRWERTKQLEPILRAKVKIFIRSENLKKWFW